MASPIPDGELPDELPARFKGRKVMQQHLNYGNGGAAVFRWHGADDRVWPVQEQYDTRRAKPATKTKPAFEPSKSGLVIVDASQPSGFYGEVCGSYAELREVWKEWREDKKRPAAASAGPVQRPLEQWPFPEADRG